MAINEPDMDKYDPWERAFAGAIDVEPLIRGIDSYERALRAHRKAHEYDASREHKERIAEKLQQHSD